MSVSERSRPELTWKDRELQAYLLERTRAGDRYFKSKYVAREIDLSPKEIGASMVKLRSALSTLEIEKWTGTSPATWHVRPTAAPEARTDGA